MRSDLVLALVLLAGCGPGCVSVTDPGPDAPPVIPPPSAECLADIEAGEAKLAGDLGRKPTDCERASARVDALTAKLGCKDKEGKPLSWAGPGPDERPGTPDDESGAQVCAVVELAGLRGVTMAPACVARACSCADVEACGQGAP